MSNNQAGKGDKPRPVDKKKYDSNFDQIAWNASTARNEAVKKGKTTIKY